MRLRVSEFTISTIVTLVERTSLLWHSDKNIPETRLKTRFEELLFKAGYTVAQAAASLGYSESHIYRWTRGEEIPRKGIVRALELEIEARQATASQASFTFVDLFAGIGGLRRSLSECGGTCIFTSEWDKFAQQTYLANYPDNRPMSGDITAIDEADIPEHDILAAGFPVSHFRLQACQRKLSWSESWVS